VSQLSLVGVIVGLTLLSAWLWHRERVARRRGTALRQLLDCADQLEAQIHDYRSRMLRLKSLLTQLPSDMTGSALPGVDTEAQVQSALRDMLAHRLWIKRESLTASQTALDDAVRALQRSSDQLAQKLQQLDEVSAQLQAAGQGLRSAYQEASAALAAMQGQRGRDLGDPGYPAEPPTPTRH
jgi:chromosome segregation ATPase